MEVDIVTVDQPGPSKAPITRPDILSREAWERIMNNTYDHNGSINLSNLLQNLDIEEGEGNSEIKNESEINIKVANREKLLQ